MNDKFLLLLNNDVNLYPSTIEVEYPHIFNKLIELWDTDQIDPYLNEVVFDDRGDRQGFQDKIGNELWKLHIHRLSISAKAKDPNKTDYWDWVN